MRSRSIAYQRLRQRGCAVEVVAQMHGYMLSTGGRFRLYLQLITSRDNQKTSFGARVLKGRAHEFVDELFQLHLARERLRDFDHRCEIEMFDRYLDRARWSPRAFVLPQPRMELVELPHLSVGAPSQIAPPRVTQVVMRDLLEAARRVKAGRELAGNRFIVHKAICARQHDGALVEVHGLERTPFDPGNLGSDQRCTILEILRTIRRPGPKVSCVRAKCFSMHGVGVGAD